MGNILDFDAKIFRSRCPDFELGVNTTGQEKGEMGMRSQTAYYAMTITLNTFIFLNTITLYDRISCVLTCKR